MTQSPEDSFSIKHPSISESEAVKPVGEGSSEEGLQQKTPSAPFSLEKSGSATAAKTSPMALSQGTSPTQELPTQTELHQQAMQIQQSMEAAKQQLQTPQLQFRPSTVELLNQHLSRIHDNLGAIASRLQLPAESTAKPAPTPPSSIEHFLGYLTDSQQQMQQISKSLSSQGSTISPADLLAVQVKMSGVQQRMEIFSVLLGKAMDSFKTLMSIQS